MTLNKPAPVNSVRPSEGFLWRRRVACGAAVIFLVMQAGYGFHIHGSTPAERDHCAYCHWISSSNALETNPPSVENFTEISRDCPILEDQGVSTMLPRLTPGRSPPILS